MDAIPFFNKKKGVLQVAKIKSHFPEMVQLHFVYNIIFHAIYQLFCNEWNTDNGTFPGRLQILYML